MTVRHAVLPVGALLVLGLGVYLFVEVRAQPAPAVAARARPAAPDPEPAALESADPAVQPGASPHGAPAAPRPAAPRTTAPVRSVGDPPPAPRDVPAAQDGPLIGPKLDAVMDEANNAYDRGDYEDAKQIAGRVLMQNPSNVRMLRIMVSASCIEGDGTVAQAAFARLPAHDQEQMRVRCARYGVAFADR